MILPLLYLNLLADTNVFVVMPIGMGVESVPSGWIPEGDFDRTSERGEEM